MTLSAFTCETTIISIASEKVAIQLTTPVYWGRRVDAAPGDEYKLIGTSLAHHPEHVHVYCPHSLLAEASFERWPVSLFSCLFAQALRDHL